LHVVLSCWLSAESSLDSSTAGGLIDRTVRKRASTRQAGSEMESKRQKFDVSSSTETSSRETSTTTTSTSHKLTSTTTSTMSDTGSPTGNTGTDTAHRAPGDETCATQDMPPDDSYGSQGQRPDAGPPPAALNGVHYHSYLLVNHLLFCNVW